VSGCPGSSTTRASETGTGPWPRFWQSTPWGFVACAKPACRCSTPSAVVSGNLTWAAGPNFVASAAKRTFFLDRKVEWSEFSALVDEWSQWTPMPLRIIAYLPDGSEVVAGHEAMLEPSS
jgi:hypothetical protein